MNTDRNQAAGSNSMPDRLNAMPGGVLITGARGFLGAHLVLDALRSTRARVTCIIRGAGQEAARQALSERLTWYFGEASWAPHRDRLRVLPGDLEKPRLGLDEGIYRELLAQPAVILNAAADVSQAGPTSRFMRTNTDSVAALVEFATTGAPKELHHVSTTSVRGYFEGMKPIAVFDETQLEQGQRFSNGYGESKYRAEVLLRRALAKGLSGAVYRVGYIGPHARTGHFQYNGQEHALARYLRACVTLGLAPYLPDRKFRITPVDCVAGAISTLARAAVPSGSTYHIDSPYVVSQYDVIRVLHAAGYCVRLMEAREFASKLRQLCSDEDTVDILSPESGGAETASTPVLDSSWSHAELERHGFMYPKPSSAWLGMYIQHAIDVGFISQPSHWRAGALVANLL